VSSDHPAVRQVLSGLYLAAIVVFTVVFLRSEWNEIVEHVGAVGAGALVLAFGCSVCGLIAGMFVFRSIIGGLGRGLPFRGAFVVYFVSQVGKYLPGSVWPAVVQLRLGTTYGVPRQANLVSFFLGLVLSLVVGVTTGFWALAIVRPSAWLLPALLAISAVAAGYLLLPAWPTVVSRLPSMMRSRLPGEAPTGRSYVEATLLLVLSWVLHGLQVSILARALGIDIDWLTLRSIGAFALAYAGGILFVVAPAGAGVREVILAALLGGDDVALLAALVLLSRVVLLIADLGLGAVGAYLSTSVGAFKTGEARPQ
jgi:glycosyltransferase 2 family protein